MPTKIYISGNFLIAEDAVSRDYFFKINATKVQHLRSPDDEFSFFQEGFTTDENGQSNSLRLGNSKAWEWDTQELIQPSQTGFEYAEIVDETGTPYASADDFDDFLNENLGGSDINIDVSGFLTKVEHDATLTGDGTLASPLSVVANASLYDERWDVLTSLVGGAWHVINTSAPSNRLISVVLDSNINNNSCGVRQVGSTLDRRLIIDKDSTAYYNVQTDSSGDIEVYTTNINVIIRIESYLK